MNPNENNPVSPMGADGSMGGAMPAPGAGSMDFTNPANLETNNSLGNDSVSGGMSDNSGMANIDGTMSGGMAAPMPPLTPAEPVPGSIGSVTSVPPLAPEPMDMGALGGAATSSNMPVMGQATENKPANESASPYYNPFTRNNVGGGSASVAESKLASMPTSSTTVPPSLQPQTEKFSDRLNSAKKPEKKQGNVMMLLGWLLAVLFLVTTIVFVVLWQGEANKKPEVVYVPTGGDDSNDDQNDPAEPEQPAEPVLAVLKCGKDIEMTEEDGLANRVSSREETTLNYTDGVLTDLTLTTINSFTDVDAATAAKPTFEEMKGMMAAVEGVSVGLDQIDAVINFGFTIPASMLEADGVSVSVNIPTNEDGSLNTSLDSMKGAFEADGYVCVTE